MNCMTTNSPIAKMFLHGQSVSDGASVHVLGRIGQAGNGRTDLDTLPRFFGIASAYKTQRHFDEKGRFLPKQQR